MLIVIYIFGDDNIKNTRKFKFYWVIKIFSILL